MRTGKQNKKPAAASPRELYERCMKREKKVRETVSPAILEAFYKQLIFGQPFFSEDAQEDPVSRLVPDSTNRKILAGLRNGARYRELVELLKKARSKETRWLILSMWLKSEGVCEPEEFLPFRLRSLARKFFCGVSIADVRYASLVEIWRPYLERLLDDRRGLPYDRQQITGELEKMGYETSAIACAQRKRSPIAATCEWLAPHENVDATAIRNAYSRCSSMARKFTSQKL